MAVEYGSLPFAEALDFFRAKLNLPTKRWDDLLGAAHDRAFVVAGAMQADLLMDLRAAVEQAIAEGTTIQTFRQNFQRIVAERGWTGWTGEGTKAGRAWRTRVIYETNLFTSYSAGRTQQMKAIADARPYWRYRHSDASVVPRAEHKAWDGTILRHDDPWWATHTPPNGFGCKCYIETLSERELKKLDLKVTPKADIPYNGEVQGVDPKTGEEFTRPEGVDKGWDYAPGRSLLNHDLAVFAEKMEKSEPAMAVAAIAKLVDSNVFRRWLSNPQGDFPLALLTADDADAIGAKTRVARLSEETAAKQRAHHPELTAGEYVQAQHCVDAGERIQDSPLSLVYLLEEAGYVTVVKATKTGESIFVTSFRRLSEDAAKRDSEIRRLRRKQI